MPVMHWVVFIRPTIPHRDGVSHSITFVCIRDIDEDVMTFYAENQFCPKGLHTSSLPLCIFIYLILGCSVITPPREQIDPTASSTQLLTRLSVRFLL